jgi:ATP-binding cassette, subfamily C (CFTR/MRP), member 1
LITLLSDFMFLFMGMRAVRTLHDLMLGSILRSTMQFFESTPTGRIINRFSKDVEATERGIPESFRMYVRCVFHVLFTIIVICYSTPMFVCVLIPIGFIYVFIQASHSFISQPNRNYHNHNWISNLIQSLFFSALLIFLNQ